MLCEVLSEFLQSVLPLPCINQSVVDLYSA